ncbi:MAG: GUN4 domain-containing protein [Cylindrospermopsis raciborskii KL1]|uniref:GUN4 domain-containing protein n=1 Tax=Cyanophyceae TaxID=3028117 RepID=UPI001A2B81D8|nr:MULTISPECIES: GUN4 domain-containing protein [Cyanophyceae]MBG0744832.1 GUN4 domain-containing protein [Cylindrospermopsis raciborskii KL1]MBG0749018.1 GUN4 domain-containing protein [Planktothrix agardhii KL2]
MALHEYGYYHNKLHEKKIKPNKIRKLIITSFLVTIVTILHPLITLALTEVEIGKIAREVTVRITGPAQGSGVILNKNNNIYTVLTNYHVLQEQGVFEIITSDGRKHQVNNLIKIGNLDLATLEFRSSQKYRVVKLGDSKRMEVGTKIYVGGFPSEKDLTFLTNTISRIEKEPQKGGYTLVYRIGAFPGMSGGPILNEDGKLVGIHGQTDILEDISTSEEYGIPLQTYLNATSTPSRYARLESLLKAQDFRAADLETDKVILAVANREKEGWLRIEDAEKFPCKELRSIDQLWLKYSRGKFGISVQQQIYQSLGGTKEYNRDVWESMGDRIGWRQRGPRGQWLYPLELLDGKLLTPAPSGHLPGHLPRNGLGVWLGGGGGWFSLLSRHAECNT